MKCNYAMLLVVITAILFCCDKKRASIQGRWINYKTEFNGRANDETGIPYMSGLDLEFTSDSIIDRTELRRKNISPQISDTLVSLKRYSCFSGLLTIGDNNSMLIEKLDDSELILVNVDREEYKRWKYYFEKVEE